MFNFLNKIKCYFCSGYGETDPENQCDDCYGLGYLFEKTNDGCKRSDKVDQKSGITDIYSIVGKKIN